MFCERARRDVWVESVETTGRNKEKLDPSRKLWIRKLGKRSPRKGVRKLWSLCKFGVGESGPTSGASNENIGIWRTASKRSGCSLREKRKET